MKLSILFLFLFLLMGCKSQSDVEVKNPVFKTELKRPFDNQGEQEDYRAQEFFKNEYKKLTYAIYDGPIIEKAATEFIYDHKTFRVLGVNDTLKLIYTKGILYPQLINGYTSVAHKTNKKLDSLTVIQRYFYELNRGDDLRVSNLEELKFLSDSLTIKRFRFWLFAQKDSNPKVYFFELTNEKAKETTSLKDFIENSKLTFFKAGWIII